MPESASPKREAGGDAAGPGLPLDRPGLTCAARACGRGWGMARPDLTARPGAAAHDATDRRVLPAVPRALAVIAGDPGPRSDRCRQPYLLKLIIDKAVPNGCRLLYLYVRADDRAADRLGPYRRRPDLPQQPRRPAGHARPAHCAVQRTCRGCRCASSPRPAPARSSAGSATTWTACRGRHQHRHVARLERRHRGHHGRRHAHHRLAADAPLARHAAVLRLHHYRVGKVRREISSQTQRSLADVSAIAEETLSVSRRAADQDLRPAGARDRHDSRARRSASPTCRCGSRWSAAGSS